MAMFTQPVPMQSLYQNADKEAFSYDSETAFNAGTLSMPGGELRTRYMGPDLLSFHSQASSSPGDTEAFDSSGRCSTVGDIDPNFNVAFHVPGTPGPCLSVSSKPLRRTYKNGAPPAKVLCGSQFDESTTSFRQQDFHLELMHSPLHSHPIMAYQGEWNDRFQGYTMTSQNSRLPMTPPGSDRLIHQQDDMARLAEQNTAAHHGHLMGEPAPLQTSQYETNIVNHTHQASMSPAASEVAIGQRYIEHPTTAPVPSPNQPSPSQILRSQPAESPSMSSWHTETVRSTVFPYTPPEIPSTDHQAWWSPTSAPIRDMHTYPHSTYQPLVMAPVPQRPNHPNGQLQGGLMIQLDTSAEVQQFNGSPLSGSALSCPEPISHSPYTPLASAHERRHGSSPFDSPIQRQYTPPSHAQSVSPSTIGSPAVPIRATSTTSAHRSPRTKQHHPAHYQQYQQRCHIRKQSSLSGGLGKNARSSTITPSNTPNPAVKAPIAVSFVNFTPDDSHKLLTGVAPSGSSKTKARREQEAREKRRKLSEAALMAVREAGGDVGPLEAVFCR